MSTLEQQVYALESLQDSHVDATVALQLHMEDMEDRSRRNNLWLRGLPEATGMEDLSETAAAIFRKVAGNSLPTSLEFEWIHRALGPRSTDPNRPLDVCRIHHYTHKENILRRAWEVGDVDFDGASVKTLPDLSRETLQRRALLHPVLDLARQLGITYRLGFPLSAMFKKDQWSFTLHTPGDLPALFTFMETDPISVPNWLLFLLQPTGRLGSSAPRRIHMTSKRHMLS